MNIVSIIFILIIVITKCLCFNIANHRLWVKLLLLCTQMGMSLMVQKFEGDKKL